MHPIGELGRDRRAQCPEIRHGILQVSSHHVELGRPVERRTPAERQESHYANGVEVGAFVSEVVADLLGR
jgi:hypothetical protein